MSPSSPPPPHSTPPIYTQTRMHACANTQHVFQHSTCVAVCCSAVQCVAACCSVFNLVRGLSNKEMKFQNKGAVPVQASTICALLRPTTNTMKHTATHTMRCNTLQYTVFIRPATHCTALQHSAPRCNTLQHTAPHGSTLQHSATRQNRSETLRCRRFVQSSVGRENARRDAAPAPVLLQLVAACCSVLQRVAVCSKVSWLWKRSPRCRFRSCVVAVCCSVLQCIAVYCSVLQCVAVWCSVVQRGAVCSEVRKS